MTLFDMSAAILMLLLATAFLAWFFSWKAAGSLRRRNAMMAKLGVDPTSLKISAVMNDVGKRCSRCRSEAECERWLAGRVDGDNSFCPNAGVFDAIRRRQQVAA